MDYNRILQGLKPNPLLTARDTRRPTLGGIADPSAGQGMTDQDPSLSLDVFNNNMMDELRGRRFQSARLGEGPEVAALEGLMKNYQGDIEDSPLTQQRAEYNAQNALDLSAQSEGFRPQSRGMATASPSQVRGEYKRNRLELAEERPYQEAQLRQETAVKQAREQGEQAYRRQQLIEDGKRDQSGRFDELLQSLIESQTNGEGGPSPIRSIRPGTMGPAVTFGAPQEQGAQGIQAGLLNKLTDATNAWATATNANQKARALQALQQARAAVISQFSGNEGNKYFVNEMMSSPETMDLPVESWIQQFRDKYKGDLEAGDFDENDIAELNALTSLIRRVPQR